MNIPGCYLNSICDAQRRYPTPLHWVAVCNIMLDYVDDPPNRHNVLAASIHQSIQPSTNMACYTCNQGSRRYTEWRSHLTYRSQLPSSIRRKMVRFFVSELRQRLSAMPDPHTSLSVPVVEVDDSARPDKRPQEHRHHYNPNYLMHLAQACFEYVYLVIVTL